MESKKQGKNQRFLSPSFKKGAIKETKKNEEFHINLMGGGSESDEKESPKPHNKSKRLSLNDNNYPQKKREGESSKKHNEQEINLQKGTIKNLFYQSKQEKVKMDLQK